MLVLGILAGMHAATAQEFGGTPPDLHWEQINTDTLRVIFPRGLETEAQQVANICTYLNRHTRASIGGLQKKASIVLQPYSVFSNGFVTLSPFHAEFQVTPPASSFTLGSLNWIHLLSIHEYRHVLQNMNFRVGLGQTFYWLFGENGQAVVTSALIPNWFWEGDAVFMETALTNQGRGRLPSFLEPFKALYYEHRQYSFAKLRNGSLKDLVPDHYPLGYMMTAYGREKYGRDFWLQATNEALLNHAYVRQHNLSDTTHPYHFPNYGLYPLSASLNYLTGTNIKGFYRRSLDYFEQQWDQERYAFHQDSADQVNPRPVRPAYQEEFPQYMGDSLLFVRYGYAYTPDLMLQVPGRHPELVVHMGVTSDVHFSAAAGKLVWTENRYHPRWSSRTYSVLVLYDWTHHKKYQLTHRSRYFSPALSPDGKRIVCMRISSNQQRHLVILDAQDGSLLHVLPNPHGYYFSYPVFNAVGDRIYSAIRDSLGNMALGVLDLKNDSLQLISPFSNKALGEVLPQGAYLFFPAAMGPNIQLFALRPSDGHLFQVMHRYLGDYSLARIPHSDSLVFAEYSSGGYRLLQAASPRTSWTPISWESVLPLKNPYVPVALQEEGGSILHKIPGSRYQVSPYRGWQHLIYLHSWSFEPSYPDLSFYLQSLNVLNTLQVNAGGGYNVNERSPFLAFNAVYGGWFPELLLGLKRQFNRQGYADATHKVYWNETNLSFGFGIPLDLSSGAYHRYVRLGTTINEDNLQFQPDPLLKRDRIDVRYLNPSLTIYNAREKAVRQIYPAFAQQLSVDYNTAVNGVFAEQWNAQLNLFFPGLKRTHGWNINAYYASRDRQREYAYTDEFVYAHGYTSVPYQQIYTLDADYQVPLAYPDFGMSWIYLLRVRLGGFYDYSQAWLLPGAPAFHQQYRSYGLELISDLKLLNYFNVPVSFRYSRLQDRDYQDPARKDHFEVSIPLQIF